MKLSRIISAFSALAILAISGGVVHAAPSSLYVTPASGTIAQGTTFTVSIVEDGDNVNVVTANMIYDASKLMCNGVGGGSFAQTISASCGGGVINISRYVTPGQPALNGAQVVATVSLTAITNSGTASVAFNTDKPSQVASGGVNTLANTSGGLYTLIGASNPNGSGNTGTNTNGGNTNNTATNGTKTTTSNASSTGSNPANTSNTSNSTSATNSPSSGVLSDNQKGNKTNGKATNDATSSQQAESQNKDTSSNTRRNLLITLGLVAVATGIVFAQRYRDQRATAQTAVAMTTKKKANTTKSKNKAVTAKTTKAKTQPKKTSTKKKNTARKK